MKDTDITTNNKISEIVCIIKLFSLLFSTIIIYNKFSTQGNIHINPIDSYLNLYPRGVFSLVSVLALLLMWCLPSTNNFKNIRVVYLVKDLAFIVVFSILIVLSKSQFSQYNFLFLSFHFHSLP